MFEIVNNSFCSSRSQFIISPFHQNAESYMFLLKDNKDMKIDVVF